MPSIDTVDGNAKFYLRQVGNTAPQVWQIDEKEAICLSVANPKGGPGTYFAPEGDETIWDAIRRGTPWFESNGDNPFVETVLPPGHYFPRIARPIAQWGGDPNRLENPGIGDHLNHIAIARSQLLALTRQLDRICQTVHPTSKTLSIFGHDIRNLLILASTEAESHWRSILVANGKAGRFTTRNYCALKDALKLDKYKICFLSYPWLEAFTPYVGWGDTPNTTKDLPWYEAYNAVKHDRETQFEHATLHAAFSSIAAIAIMLVAQFGYHRVIKPSDELSAILNLSAIPFWKMEEMYLWPFDPWPPKAIPFPFV